MPLSRLSALFERKSVSDGAIMYVPAQRKRERRECEDVHNHFVRASIGERALLLTGSTCDLVKMIRQPTKCEHAQHASHLQCRLVHLLLRGAVATGTRKGFRGSTAHSAARYAVQHTSRRGRQGDASPQHRQRKHRALSLGFSTFSKFHTSTTSAHTDTDTHTASIGACC